MSEAGTRAVDRGTARKSLAKAEEFCEGAQVMMDAGRPNSAALAAIHAGIAAADAALIASAGVRSSARDHGAVIPLLESRVDDFGSIQRRQLMGLLKMKNTVAYEDRLVTDLEARQLVDQAKRLTKWSRDTVEKRLSG